MECLIDGLSQSRTSQSIQKLYPAYKQWHLHVILQLTCSDAHFTEVDFALCDIWQFLRRKLTSWAFTIRKDFKNGILVSLKDIDIVWISFLPRKFPNMRGHFVDLDLYVANLI